MSAASMPKNAKWTDPEVLAMLNTLIGKKSSHQSGTGWKPSVWTEVINAVQQVDPTADPVKDKAKVITNFGGGAHTLGRSCEVEVSIELEKFELMDGESGGHTDCQSTKDSRVWSSKLL
ncbi:hypothetical protein K438DRAFT_2113068 [Mycena galopus ATCC 62051]|nr:hypothetical protein K438DRAFT_2113068 [Mycena galopus ATCC 62051]